MVTEAGKELLRNTINTAKFHNRILEENEMWKQWDLECGLTMMVSDDDIIKRIKKNNQCSKNHRRDKSRSRDSSRSRSRHGRSKTRIPIDSSNDRWDHSGFAELYPDADVPDKYPSASNSFNRHTKEKKKKSHHRSNSSDKEIWEEFKRPAKGWNKENTLRLIQLLSKAPALWNINYAGYKSRDVRLKELKRISSQLHVEESDVDKQISILMNEFYEEHKKRSLRNLRGACAKSSENEWFAYEHLTFLIKNNHERTFKTVENIPTSKNPHWFDSSDSYSDSEEETSAQPSTSQRSCFENHGQDVDKVEGTSIQSSDLSRTIKNKMKYVEISESIQSHGSKATIKCTSLPFSQTDDFSAFGEMVACRLREAKKGSKAIEEAKYEINAILNLLENGFFDSARINS